MRCCGAASIILCFTAGTLHCGYMSTTASVGVDLRLIDQGGTPLSHNALGHCEQSGPMIYILVFHLSYEGG